MSKTLIPQLTEDLLPWFEETMAAALAQVASAEHGSELARARQAHEVKVDEKLRVSARTTKTSGTSLAVSLTTGEKIAGVSSQQNPALWLVGLCQGLASLAKRVGLNPKAMALPTLPDRVETLLAKLAKPKETAPVKESSAPTKKAK